MESTWSFPQKIKNLKIRATLSSKVSDSLDFNAFFIWKNKWKGKIIHSLVFLSGLLLKSDFKIPGHSQVFHVNFWIIILFKIWTQINMKALSCLQYNFQINSYMLPTEIIYTIIKFCVQQAYAKCKMSILSKDIAKKSQVEMS